MKRFSPIFLFAIILAMAIGSSPAHGAQRVADEKVDLVKDWVIASGTVQSKTTFKSPKRSFSRVVLRIKMEKTSKVTMSMTACTIVSPNPCANGKRKIRSYSLKGGRSYRINWRVNLRSKKKMSMQSLSVYHPEAMFTNGSLALWRLDYWERCPECEQ